MGFGISVPGSLLGSLTQSAPESSEFVVGLGVAVPPGTPGTLLPGVVAPGTTPVC